MRILLNIKFPNEEFNEAVEEGNADKLVGRILDDAAPEAVYFTEADGQRAAVMVVDVQDASEIPRYAEPWFLTFNAEVEFRIAMTPDDLKRAGLNKLGNKWT